MSETKITVKDLSAELNVPPKELLSALRQLGIQAKSAASIVPAENLDRVRTHFKTPEDASAQRKEAQPDVIVRRRRRADEAEVAAPAAPAAPVAAATAAPSPVAEAPAQAAPVPTAAQEAAPEAPASSAATPADSAEAVPPASSQKAPTARVIRRPQDETPQARIIASPKVWIVPA